MTLASACRHDLGGRLHQREWNGADTGSSIARRTPLAFGDFDRALDRGLVPGDDDLTAAIVVGGLAHLTLRGLGRDGGGLLEIDAEQRGHGARADRHRLLHGAAADAHAAGQHRRCRQRTRRRQRRILAERMTGDELRVAREIDAGLGFEHPHGRERYRHQRGLRILRQRQGLGRPFPDDLGELLAERLVDLFEHPARRREGLRKALPMPTAWLPWPGKMKASDMPFP